VKIKEQSYTLKNGKVATIKSTGPEDGASFNRHMEMVSAETHFMARCPEDGQFNLERRQEQLAAVGESETDFSIGVYVDGEIVGQIIVSMLRPHLKFRHRFYLGMSIQQKYTGEGLGSFLMELAIAQAEANGMEQLELGVFSDNDRARHLYQKYDFKEYGMNPRAFKLKDGSYRDEIIMVKFLK